MYDLERSISTSRKVIAKAAILLVDRNNLVKILIKYKRIN